MKKTYYLVLLTLFSLFPLLFSCKSQNSGEDFSLIPYRDESFSVDNDKIPIIFDESFEYASFSAINSGTCFLYKAKEENRKNITVCVNAGHGCIGGNNYKTYSHPDKSPKITGGTNEKGSVKSISISDGMTFDNGMRESEINRRVAVILRKLLLDEGFDVLMIRDTADVQLDNIARTLIANNYSDIHISIHFDGDSFTYDKGCFYCSIPEELKSFSNVNNHFNNSEKLGECLISSLKESGLVIYKNGKMKIDLTQTCYSTIPTCDIELGNNKTKCELNDLLIRAKALCNGIITYFSFT